MNKVNYKNKTIEFVKVQFAYKSSEPGKQVDPITFCDILEHENTPILKYRIPNEKWQQLTILENTSEYIIGVIITTSISGIPPKHNFESNKTKKIDLEESEGLGFANVFLYYKTKKVLLYEFNRNGCYLSALKEFLKYIVGHIYKDKHITLEWLPILKRDIYETYQKMRVYQQVEYVVANPTHMIAQKEKSDQDNKALIAITNEAKDLNAESVQIVYKGDTKAGGLTPKKLWGIVGDLYSKSMTQKLVVSGYLEDNENKKIQHLDLLNGALKGNMKLKEPKVLQSLLLAERTDGITKVFKDAQNELDSILK